MVRLLFAVCQQAALRSSVGTHAVGRRVVNLRNPLEPLRGVGRSFLYRTLVDTVFHNRRSAV